ncbi:MAG: HAMP domain-containing protein [Proteobacteria bacterium]|nr:HAMP domain-containing protein [Pseudomonadota bacterium]
MSIPPRSLHTRISLLLTGLAAILLMVLASLWVHGMRSSIHEEISAANRVSVQWLKALASDVQSAPPEFVAQRVLSMVRPLGRIRANALEVFTEDGRRLYASPAPTYKADRTAPGWFTALVAPVFAVHRVGVGNLELVISPDHSRAVVDAWDDLQVLCLWAVALLGALFALVRWALGRTMRPLEQVMDALDCTGGGRFDVRLPVFPLRELGRLSLAFNGMADRLEEAVEDNVCLKSEREVARLLQARMEDERRAVARELHDALAQGITGARTLAGAIAQRTHDQPALHHCAQSIVALTGEMQDGIKAILHRLRSALECDLAAAIEHERTRWGWLYPHLELGCRVDIGSASLSADIAQTALRVVQEGLINIVRHAKATRAELWIERSGGWLNIRLSDNGCGLGSGTGHPGSGLGLTGMRERIAAQGGQLELNTAASGGLCVLARLPDHPLSALESAA